MNILLTGANGRIGPSLHAALLRAGHTVTATDLRPADNPNAPILACDLLNRDAVRHIATGAEAIVHFGAHASHHAIPDITRLYLENVTMTAYLLEAAAAVGVRKFIFASSIQVIHGGFSQAGHLTNALAALPIDGDTPPRPTNAYGASKQSCEVLLRLAADRQPMESVALRLPWMFASVANAEALTQKQPSKCIPDMYIAGMTYADAGSLVVAILASTLPGYRCYQPSRATNLLQLPAAELHQRQFPYLPLKTPSRPLNCLVDLTRLTQETGWSPPDSPLGTGN